VITHDHCANQLYKLVFLALTTLISTFSYAAPTPTPYVAADHYQVSAGGRHTCTLDDNGVHCWGYERGPQVNVPKLIHPVAVSAGHDYTCAIDDTGVHCWGFSFLPEVRSGHSMIPSMTHPKMVSVGAEHTCALDDNGVHCWGGNDWGQITVPSLTNPKAMSAGGAHTCALDDNGVHCWGRNSSGQTTVPSLINPVIVSAGHSHTCALDDNGVHCWGENHDGQTNVPTLIHPVAISAGGAHTCALDDSGVHCWGYNPTGQTNVPNLTNPVAVSAGYFHTCALDDTGVHCWGSLFNSPMPLCLTFGGALTCSPTETISIRAKAGVGGTIYPSGHILVRKNSDPNFYITSNLPAKYEIKDVKVDGVSQGARTYYTFSDVDAKHKIVASFKVRSYDVTVTNEQPTLGKLNFTGVKTLKYGQSLIIKAKPSNSLTKAEISVDGNVVNSGLVGEIAIYKLLVDDAHTLSVRFLTP
jgi:Regulator of chromosome condensation (RCC1) repeat